MTRKIYGCFGVMVLLSLLMTTMILCVPFVQIEGTPDQRMGAYIVAAVFWISIIGQIVMSYVCKTFLKKAEPKKYYFRKVTNGHLAVMTFFTSREAMVADVALFISAIAVAVLAWSGIINKWLIIGTVALLVLSLNMHCLLNGKNYRCMKLLLNNTKERKGNE